ncbi:MAG: glycosyltransferase family 39 protein [Caldilineaceae bacterium]
MSRQMGLAPFASASVVRVALLLLIIFSFARVIWRLDANNLWWDESLSLQRAESDLGTLLRKEIVLFDGREQLPTTDQHPFGFFLLLGLLVRLIGTDEFVLRFPAVMGTTLLVPVMWAVARYGVRWSILPEQTPFLAAALAAFSPFFLYYGQEARMYTLLPVLALVTTYLLLRWREALRAVERRRFLIGYAITTLVFLVTHYFSVLLLPVHALLFFQSLYRRHRRLAWGIAVGLLLLGLLLGVAASWIILSQPLSGRNFQPITLGILAPDLLNAYSLGLSVNIAQVWWLDLVFGAIALVGAVWTVRRWTTIRAGGWIWSAGILGPILLLLAINQVQPAYMNARHLALISGLYLMLLAAGVALVWRWFKPAGGLLLTILLAGMIYSSVNYYTMPLYGKDDFAGLGSYLRRELTPGDVLVLNPPEMLRLYRYYLPVDLIEDAQQQGVQVAWLGAPLFDVEQTSAALDQLRADHQRVWVVTSGMVPWGDPLRTVRSWMEASAFQIRDVNYFSSQSFLELDLYLAEYPAMPSLPQDAIPVEADFDGKIEVLGYRIEQPLTTSSVIPIRLYWRAMQPLDTQYKYLLYLAFTDADGSPQRLPATEREPYDGYLPTNQWPAGEVWVEYSDVFMSPEVYGTVDSATLKLVLQIYEEDTLAPLPVLTTAYGEIGSEGDRIIFDFPVPAPDLQ